jgi:lipopolysaccharide/colanic/teichoic acid biosynthesis glycosyltransferase
MPRPPRSITVVRGADIAVLGTGPRPSDTAEPSRNLALRRKRLFDVVVGSAAMVLLAPLLGAVGTLIGLVDGRPVMFRQTRIGLDARPFQLIKFRTMERGAEDLLDDLMDRNEIRGPAFKVTDDPRLTRLGRILRSTSLDELPQIWNVLRNDMSLVGPRPPLPREVDAYDPWHHRRLAVKPGITGLWQVQARQGEDFDQRVELDLDYIDRWSMRLDLEILVRTIPAMFKGR